MMKIIFFPGLNLKHIRRKHIIFLEDITLTIPFLIGIKNNSTNRFNKQHKIFYKNALLIIGR